MQPLSSARAANLAGAGWARIPAHSDAAIRRRLASLADTSTISRSWLSRIRARPQAREAAMHRSAA
jgi:hypothetical protein